MKQIPGNNPKCWSCYYYHEAENGEKMPLDYTGWCVEPYNCSHGVNGRKYDKPKEREGVRANDECRHWEDAETRISHFDYLTGGMGKE